MSNVVKTEAKKQTAEAKKQTAEAKKQTAQQTAEAKKQTAQQTAEAKKQTAQQTAEAKKQTAQQTAEAVKTVFAVRKFAEAVKTAYSSKVVFDTAYDYLEQSTHNAFYKAYDDKKCIFSLYVLDSKSITFKIECNSELLDRKVVADINSDLKVTTAKADTVIKVHFSQENTVSAKAIIDSILTAYAQKKQKAEAKKQTATADSKKQTATA